MRLAFWISYQIFFALALGLAIKFTLGDVLALGPGNLMAEWNQTEPSSVEPKVWQQADQAMANAVVLRGSTLTLLLDQARLAAWEPQSSGQTSADPEAYQRALQLTEQAVERYPLSDLAWAQLAFYRSFVGQDWAQIEPAYATGMQLGRFREPALMLLVRVGFRHWDQLSERQIAQFEAVLQDLGTLNPGYVASVALKYQRVKDVYRVLRSNPQLIRRILVAVRNKAYQIRHAER